MEMNMKKTLLISLLTVCVIAGCSKDGTQGSSLPLKDNVIYVTAEINEPLTRAGYDADNLDEFALMIRNRSNSLYTYNKKMIGAGSSWSAEDGELMIWDAERTPVDVIALAPYVETYFDGIVSTSANFDQSVADNVKASDFLLMKSQVNPDSDLVDGKLKISLDHLMSKLSVKLTVDGNPADMSKVSGMSINGVLLDGSCNLSEDTPEVRPVEDAVKTMVTPYKSDDAYECILIPQTVADGISVNFMYDGKLYVWESENNISLKKAVEHILTLNIVTTKAQKTMIQAYRLETVSLADDIRR